MLNYTKIREYLKKHRQNSVLRKVLTGVAAVVVFATTYALILPAITMETKPACGVEEHLHNEIDCYSNGGEFTCQLVEHVHTEECYSEEEVIASVSSNKMSEMPAEVDSGTVSSNDSSADFSDEGVSSNGLTPQKGNASGADASLSEVQPEQTPLIEKRATDGKVVITAGYTELARIPESAQLVAYQVTAENASERYEQRQEEIRTILGELSDIEIPQDEEFMLYNVGFYEEGTEIEPADTVSVTIQLPSESDFLVNDPVTVIHFAEEGTETIKATHVAQDGEGKLFTSFAMKSFSDIALAVYDLDEANEGNSIYAADDTTRTVTTADEFWTAIEDTTFNGTIIIDAAGDETALEFSYAALGKATPVLGEGRDVTINLNGHQISVDDTFVKLIQGAKLQVIDEPVDGKVNEQVNIIDLSGGELPYGHEATYDADTNTLTYYVTKTAVEQDSTTGETVETLEEHIAVGKGVITGTGTNHVFQVEGSTLTIDSGMIANSTSYAIHATQGTLNDTTIYSEINLNGGYICANNQSATDQGGAIRAYSDTVVNLSGTVIAGNKAVKAGGIRVEDSTLNITGGVVSGNVAAENGAGIMAIDSEVNMSAGYITNNVAKETGNYYSGGGGMLLTENATFTLDAGYITGNTASSGGGIYAQARFVMNGGFLTANYASEAEGGGIRLEGGSIGTFNGGYITNNVTNTDVHWGGGGIFIADGATGFLTSVLITQNTAEAFGGGVAGCSTGRIYMSAIDFDSDGAAIYSNNANYSMHEGTDDNHLSGDASAKPEDHIYAATNTVFKESGYQDYFCMLYSNVVDGMLGGGSENWTGSIDGVKVMTPEDGVELTGNSVAGLTADPSSVDKTNAENAAKVYVNGNSSNTHGGGILCNGYMILGAVPESINLGTRIELYGTKDYLDSTGNAFATMPEGVFKFTITDAADEVVAVGTNDTNGAISFDRRIVFDGEGTYVFYVTEDSATEITVDGKRVQTDKTKYKVSVTTKATQRDSIDVGNGTSITRTVFLIEKVTIDKQVGGTGDWVKERDVTPYLAPQETHAISLDLTGGTSFTNYQVAEDAKTSITVNKKWGGDGTNKLTSVDVTLYRQVDGGEKEAVGAPVTLNDGNGWTYTWTEQPIWDDNDKPYAYTVEETISSNDYLVEYEYSNTAVTDSYWIPADASDLKAGSKYMIVYQNQTGDQNVALKVTQAHNGSHFDGTDIQDVSGAYRTEAVEGMTYTDWYDPDAIVSAIGEAEANRLIFSAQSYNGGIILKNNGNDSSWLLVQRYDATDVGELQRLKGCFGTAEYASQFEYDTATNSLQGHYEWSEDGELNTIVYLNSTDAGGNNTSRFTAMTAAQMEASDSETVAKLYTLKNKSIGGATTVTITNTHVDEVKFELEITKVSEANKTLLLPGAEFRLLDGNDNPLHFSYDALSGEYTVFDGSAADDGTILTSNAYGQIIVKGLDAATYTLQETEAPTGYLLAEDKEITFTVTGDAAKTKQEVVIADPEDKFFLPKTGGEGTIPYMIAGLMLVFGSAACLLYRANKKREEGTAR